MNKKNMGKAGCMIARLCAKVDSAFVQIKKGITGFCKSVAACVKRQATSIDCGLRRSKLVLCGTYGGGPGDIALGIIIAVVMTVIVLAALKQLFNVNILPPITSKVDTMLK